jgi:hypothetical protein|tara:strand:+ start:34545 stop:35216 length:672 start_codon:yes stop_codon:yes gene_type:complete
MAEFMYWKIGEGIELLINEQAYLDYRSRLEKIGFTVGNYIARVNGVDPRAYHSVDGFIALNTVDERGDLQETFFNAQNIEMAVTHGKGKSAITNVLLNCSDEFYQTMQSAEQISRAGMCDGWYENEGEHKPSIYRKSPHVYECPMSSVKVHFNEESGLEVSIDQVAVIERHYSWEQERVTVLPYLIYSREDMQGLVPKAGHAAFSTQKEDLEKMSYIYPTPYK